MLRSQPAVETEGIRRPGAVCRNPHHGQHHHPQHAAPDTFPALAGADGRSQLVPGEAQAEGTACKIRADVGRPHQGQDGQQEIGTDHPGLCHGQPGQPQGQHATHQPHGTGNTRPAGHTGAQHAGTGQHPEGTRGQPDGRQGPGQPASPPGARTQQHTCQRQQQATAMGAAVEPPPFPAGGCNQHQCRHTEGHRGWIKQGWQQDGQQDQGGDDTLFEHGRNPLRRSARSSSIARMSCRNAARAAGRP